MTNKSGISEQIITSPKGGGALSGIGEKFSPDLFTGTGNFTVPIALPPGRNGFQPELNLVYSTGNGNGPFGLGWSLSVPGVSRQTSKGIPRYRDYAADLAQRDTFVLSGAEDLVPVAEGAGWARYRPRTEGLFARITHYFGDGMSYWKVESKEGLTSYYGTEPADRLVDVNGDWQDPAAISDPAEASHIFAWKLSKTVDPFGNRILYTYRRDARSTDVRHWDQLYLADIKYVEYSDPLEATATGVESFLIRVAFDYGEDERLDPFSVYRSGFEIRTAWICRQIRVETRPNRVDRAQFYRLDTSSPDLPDRILARTYDFTYRNDAPNGVSLLRQIQVTGHDESQLLAEKRIQALPPLVFGYTAFDPTGRDFFPLTGELPAHSLASPDLELADLFGNGLPDIVQMNGAVRYWRNRGNGCFDLPRTMTYAPAGLSLADPGVQLIDADGDARVDLLATVDGLAGYFPLRFGAEPSEVGWDQRSFQRYTAAPSFNLEDPEVRLIDLTGDGVTDAIRSGSRLECFFNEPKTGWGETGWGERGALEVFPNVNFSDPRVKWGDMSGDGLQDILLIHDGNVEYWPNLGYGDWGARIHMANSPRFPSGHDPRRILVGDVDGDGLADIIYVEDTQVTLWINQSGNGYSAPLTIDGTPPVSDMDAVRLADMLGSGVSGVLWTRDATANGRAHYFFLDFTGGVKPYVLDEMDNHMGAVTRVQYRPSTWYYRQDADSPATRWRTPLPFPVQVVAKVEVIDAISQGKLTTEYRYHHGYWDGAEREFRGFGLVEQLDTESFESYNGSGLHGEGAVFKAVDLRHFTSPMLTKTWFHQGPVGEEYGAWEPVEWTEADWSAMYWPGDPQLLRHTEQVNAFLQSLTDRQARRDALRALRGQILRTELYALDESERAGRPYTVTEHAFGLREEDASTPSASQCPHIYFPHTVGQRVTQWERGEDPMTQFSFTGAYDAYGQPQQQTALALPRRQAKRVAVTGAVVGTLTGDEVNETHILATHTRTEYAMSHLDRYMHNRVAQVETYELEAPPTVAESEPESLGLILQEQRDAALRIDAQFQQLAGVRLIGHALNHYDGDAYSGLPTNQLGAYGALTRSETLVFTDHELDAAYGERRPAYLGGAATLPAGAPSGFGENLGYRREGAPPTGYHDGYYTDTQRQRLDFQTGDGAPAGQTRGLVLSVEDALGHRAMIGPDAYWLLPVTVTDPAGLTTTATYDYRVLQPRMVTDPNENATHFRFTPLGLLDRQFLVGREGQGGTEERPEVRFSYDFVAWMDPGSLAGSQPVYVHTQRRIEHASESSSDAVIESREYSDGFGRLVQTRAQAEELVFGATGDDVGLPPAAGSDTTPAVGHSEPDRVVVSGWQIYDNKGRVIEKYEPFFDIGWDYQREAEAKQGQHVTMYYDPRGQVIRTVSPDFSEQRVIYGVPGTVATPELREPERYEPTPWEAYTYDANDNAERTHVGLAASGRWQHHLDTPASILLDGLGRTILAIARNRHSAADVDNPPEHYLTRSRYDVRGNLETVIDARGRLAFQYRYDLTTHKRDEDDEGAQVLQIDQLDGGIRSMVLDAMGNEIERQDSKGALILRAYDAVNRPLWLWAKDGEGQPLTLREHLVYGDNVEAGLNKAEAQQGNLLGQIYRHYDEAGLLTFEAYDFKGNLLEKMRKVISDETVLMVFRDLPSDWQIPAFRVDWQPPPGVKLVDHANALLDATEYRMSSTYDALNRVKAMHYPRDVEGVRHELQPHYNQSGALESLSLDSMTYVERIAYNAKGQRLLIAYGNGIMTRYAYEPQTFRLVRLRSERYEILEPLAYSPRRAAAQDFSYEYDLAGNIVTIRDRTTESGIPDTLLGRDALDRTFTYDPLYRLLSATGRECDTPLLPNPWDDAPKCHDVTLARGYTEWYSYDQLGNLIQMRHATHNPGNVGGFGRYYSLVDRQS